MVDHDRETVAGYEMAHAAMCKNHSKDNRHSDHAKWGSGVLKPRTHEYDDRARPDRPRNTLLGVGVGTCGGTHTLRRIHTSRNPPQGTWERHHDTEVIRTGRAPFLRRKAHTDLHNSDEIRELYAYN